MPEKYTSVCVINNCFFFVVVNIGSDFGGGGELNNSTERITLQRQPQLLETDLFLSMKPVLVSLSLSLSLSSHAHLDSSILPFSP